MSVISDKLRRVVEERAGRRCEYCRVAAAAQVGTFRIDHILPRSRGGQTALGNLALTCDPCNGHKWAHVDGLDPDTGATVPLFNPRADSWDEHFQWSLEGSAVLLGKTPKGRATIERLKMNHPLVVRARRWLAQLEIEQPE